MNDGYEIDPLEKKQRVPDLDTLGELAPAGDEMTSQYRTLAVSESDQARPTNRADRLREIDEITARLKAAGISDPEELLPLPSDGLLDLSIPVYVALAVKYAKQTIDSDIEEFGIERCRPIDESKTNIFDDEMEWMRKGDKDYRPLDKSSQEYKDQVIRSRIQLARIVEIDKIICGGDENWQKFNSMLFDQIVIERQRRWADFISSQS